MKRIITTVVNSLEPTYDHPIYNQLLLFMDDNCKLELECVDEKGHSGSNIVFDNTNHQIIGVIKDKILVWDSDSRKLLQTSSKILCEIKKIKQIILDDDTVFLLAQKSDSKRTLLFWDRKTGIFSGEQKDCDQIFSNRVQIFADSNHLISLSGLPSPLVFPELQFLNKKTGACEFVLKGSFTDFKVQGDFLITQWFYSDKVEIRDKHNPTEALFTFEGKLVGSSRDNLILFQQNKNKDSGVLSLVDLKSRPMKIGERVKRDIGVWKAILDGDDLILFGCTPHFLTNYIIGVWNTKNKKWKTIERYFTKLELYFDFIVAKSLSHQLTLINKHTLKPRVIAENIKEFWVNTEKKEIVTLDSNRKLHCLKCTHPFPTSIPAQAMIDDMVKAGPSTK